MIPLHDNVPTRHLPILTVALIVINLAVFVWAEHAPAQRLPTSLGIPVKVSGFTAVTAEYGFVPCEIESRCAHGDDEILLGQDQLGRPVYGHVHHIPVLASVFTAMFMHGSWEHVLGNMLFLWIFGNNIEDRVGRRRYLDLLRARRPGGVAAAVPLGADVRSAEHRRVGRDRGRPRRLPRALPQGRGDHLHPADLPDPAAGGALPDRLDPAAGLLGELRRRSGGGGVAYYAHIGGFAFGLLTIRWWVRA